MHLHIFERDRPQILMYRMCDEALPTILPPPSACAAACAAHVTFVRVNACGPNSCEPAWSDLAAAEWAGGAQRRQRMCFTSEMIHIQNSARSILKNAPMPDRAVCAHRCACVHTAWRILDLCIGNACALPPLPPSRQALGYVSAMRPAQRKP